MSENYGMAIPEPTEFARTWAAAWNARDIDAVLEHFADDVVFTSPVAQTVVPSSGGIIRGKAQLRDYWVAAIAKVPDLLFTIEGVYAGVSVLVINYRNQRGVLVNEVLSFRDGVVVEGHGTYLDEV